MEKEIHEMLYAQLKGNISRITVGEIETFLNNYARVVIKAAQHRAQLTAIGGFTGVAFLLGVIVGLLAAHFGGN